MSPKIKIKYIDGEIIEAPAGKWHKLRPEGIDEITISNPLPVTCKGHSLYWFYKEKDYYALGCASPYQPVLTPEILFIGDKQTSRPIDCIPDLHLKDVKLGWWRPGEDRP